ncbi:hypothetical protein HGO41_13625 [Rahnella sp. CG8]|uniref:glutaminase n=1 Tax=Yersiniaceae TaxID=1903411 RepID=UPI001013CD69|nr:hypothetical protein [Rahnella sp. CG8]
MSRYLFTVKNVNAAGEDDACEVFPLKRDVDGGIVVLIPAVGSLCVWSPGLDQIGNSMAWVGQLSSLSATQGFQCWIWG